MKSQQWFALFLTMLLALLLGSNGVAAELNIKVEKDPYAVFYPAKTYSWHPLSAVYPKFDVHFRAAIDRELTSQGFQKAAAGNPDFWVGYQFYKTDSTKEIKKGTKGDYTWEEKKYREGTLTIDIFSPDQRRIIFRISADKVYDPDLSDEEKIKMLNNGIKQMATKLPPPG